MRNITDFLLTLVLPRKMVKYRTTPFIISLLLFSVAFLLVPLGSNSQLPRYLRKDYPDLSYSGLGPNNKFNQFVDYSINSDNQMSINNKTGNEVYNERLEYIDGTKRLDLTVVFDSSVHTDYLDKGSLENFDLDGYLKQAKSPIRNYALYIFTRDRLFYIADLGEDYLNDNNYQKNELDEVVYFLPADEHELAYNKYDEYDVNRWTRRVSKHDVINFDEYDKVTYNKEIKPTPKYNSNLKFAITNSNIINSITYKELLDKDFNIDLLATSLVDFLNATEELGINYRNLSYNNLKTIDKSFTIYDYKLSTKTYELITDGYFQRHNIFHDVLDFDYNKPDSEKIKKLDITYVFDMEVQAIGTEDQLQLKSFDLDGYYKQERIENTVYILFIFTKDRLYYLYDLGQKYIDSQYIDLDSNNYPVYQVNSNRERKYFLPTKVEDLRFNDYGGYDTSRWSEVTKDATVNFDYDQTKFSDPIISQPIHQPALINAIYTGGGGNGFYGYSQLKIVGYDPKVIGQDIRTFLQETTECILLSNVETNKLLSTFISFVIYIISPLIWAFVVWIIGKRFYLKRYKEYYAIAAVSWITSSILGFIIGFILPYDTYGIYFMFFQIWYFVFVIFRISTDKKRIEDEKNNDNESNDFNQPTKPKLEYKNIGQLG